MTAGWSWRARAAGALCALAVLYALLAWQPAPAPRPQVTELFEIEDISVAPHLAPHPALLPTTSPAPAPTPPSTPPPAQPLPLVSAVDCRMHSCFDYSRCPLSDAFSFFFYDPHELEKFATIKIDEYLKSSFTRAFTSNPQITIDPQSACIFVVLLGESTPLKKTNSSIDESSEWSLNVTVLSELPHWGEDGRNHVLVYVSRSQLGRGRRLVGDTGRALLAQSGFPRGRHRAGFDLVLPPALGPPASDGQDCPPMAPARRRYLLTFQGVQTSLDERATEAGALEALLGTTHGPDVLLEWRCEAEEGQLPPPPGEWALCGSEEARRSLLAASTFALVPGGAGGAAPLLLARLLGALQAGAVPVLLDTGQLLLPFAETVEWRRGAVVVPGGRARDVPRLLRATPDADVLLLRRHGRLLWERYLSSVQATTDSLLSTLRTRLLLPPPPAPAAPAPPAFGDSYTPPHLVRSTSTNATHEEKLGPVEPPFPSPAYTRNFSLALVYRYAMWNEWLDPFTMFPHWPWEPVVASEARFVGPRALYRPLERVRGAGGPAARLRAALGGDYPREQFTIVILSYERPVSLVKTLTELKGLPYLNKVVVVWNGESDPASMSPPWPESGARVAVVRGYNNSLNNRFLPYDVVDTEAVLCLDDDTHLRHDEIILAFRVWRQHRDQIVGFPARTHTWSDAKSGFLYYSSNSCELSMVLTGAAFIHRFYMFAYWRRLPRAIRDYVDSHKNCEDIAMNYLVSHITRKPPIKVTGRSLFGSAVGPTLSSKKSHYEERNMCIQFFTKVLGYTPLMLSQYRADSILYNTRMSDANKCFRNV